MTTWRWIISHRLCWITVYVFCRNAHINIIVIIMSYICIVMRSIFCQLPSCNLFTQHVSYLLWRDTTSELWTQVHSFTLIIQPTANTVPFHSLQFTTVFHTIRLILCFQQARKIDTLPALLGQSSLIVLCAGSTSTAELPSTRKYFSGTVDNLQKCFLLLLDLITLVSY